MSPTLWLSAVLGALLLPIQAQIYSPETLRNHKLILRKTVNDNRKVYVRLGEKEAYYIHDKGRLFPIRRAEPVVVSDVNRKPDFTEVVFTSENLGKGKIRLYGASSTELFDAAIRSAFSESPEAGSALIANKKSRFVHFAGSNHLPAQEDREPVSEEALKSGDFVKCPLCFSKVPRVSRYDLEMRLGEGVVGQIHARYALVTDDKIQNRVLQAGQTVLSKWVTPLKGYRYKFYAIESELANAFACPGGKIYITSALSWRRES